MPLSLAAPRARARRVEELTLLDAGPGRQVASHNWQEIEK